MLLACDPGTRRLLPCLPCVLPSLCATTAGVAPQVCRKTSWAAAARLSLRMRLPCKCHEDAIRLPCKGHSAKRHPVPLHNPPGSCWARSLLMSTLSLKPGTEPSVRYSGGSTLRGPAGLLRDTNWSKAIRGTPRPLLVQHSQLKAGMASFLSLALLRHPPNNGRLALWHRTSCRPCPSRLRGRHGEVL